MTTLPFNRPLAAFVLLTFCAGVGCSSVRTVGPGQISESEAKSLVGKQARFYTADGLKTGTVASAEYPYVVCHSKSQSRGDSAAVDDEVFRTRVDLREVYRVEVREMSWGKTLLFVGLGAWIVVMAFKESGGPRSTREPSLW